MFPAVLDLAARAGLKVAPERWYKSLSVQGMEYKGDKCAPKDNTRSCMVYLHPKHRGPGGNVRNAPEHPYMHVHHPLALIAAFVVLPGVEEPQALVRVVPAKRIFPHQRLNCRMIVGWRSYRALAMDTEAATPKLVPVSWVRMPAVVVDCSSDRLTPRDVTSRHMPRDAWRKTGGALGVVPYM